MSHWLPYLAPQSSKHVRFKQCLSIDMCSFFYSVCGFDLIVRLLAFWICQHFCFFDMFVFGCAVDPVVLMCVLCRTPPLKCIWEKEHTVAQPHAPAFAQLPLPSLFSLHPFTPDAPLLHGSLCFCAWNQMGEKSGHLLYEAGGIDYFFGLLCGSGGELQQRALLGIIMPTHSVPSLGQGRPDAIMQREDSVREVRLSELICVALFLTCFVTKLTLMTRLREKTGHDIIKTRP